MLSWALTIYLRFRAYIAIPNEACSEQYRQRARGRTDMLIHVVYNRHSIQMAMSTRLSMNKNRNISAYAVQFLFAVDKFNLQQPIEG